MNLEALKQVIDLERFITERYNLTFQQHRTTCPLHEDKEPSFYVRGNMWSCFGCNLTGKDIFDLLMQKEGMSFREAIKEVAAWAQFPLDNDFDQVLTEIKKKRKDNGLIADFYNQFKCQKLPDCVIKFLETKQINPGGIDIGYIYQGATPEYKKDEQRLIELGILHQFQNGQVVCSFSDTDRILIPVERYGKYIYIYSRALVDVEKVPRYKNLKLPPVVIGTPRRGLPLYILEGVTDWLRGQGLGLNCISIPGSGIKTINIPQEIKDIRLLFDNDPQGQDYTLKYGLMLYERGHDIQVVKLPDGVGDLCQLQDTVESLETIQLYNYILSLYINDRETHRDNLYTFLKYTGDRDIVALEDAFKELRRKLGVPLRTIKEDFIKWKDKRKDKGGGIFRHHGNDLNMPENYTLRDGKVYQVNPPGCICVHPLGITNYGVNRFSGAHYMDVSTGIDTHTLPREIVADKTKLMQLSRYGVDIYSDNAPQICRYLNLFYQANTYSEPYTVVDRLGWIGDNFVLPGKIISNGEKETDIHYIDGNISKETFIPRGTLQGWKDTIALYHDIPHNELLIFLLYAGFAGVIKKKIGGKSIIIHLFNDSSCGKSISCMAPLSICGNPDKTSDGLMYQWRDTAVGKLRTAGELRNIPICFDELSTELKQNVQSTIYTLYEGTGKAMGDKNNPLATVARRDWCTTFFSTGEPRVIRDNSLSGAAARTIQISQEPIPKNHKSMAVMLETRLKMNYGHALEPFLREFFSMDMNDIGLFMNEKDFEKFQGPVGRFAEQFQDIYRAAVVAEKAFRFGFNIKKVLKHVLDQCLKDLRIATDISERFMYLLRDFFFQNEPSFVSVGKNDMYQNYSRETTPKGQVVNGYIIQRDYTYDLGILKSRFSELCREIFGGQAIDHTILKSLKNKGYIETEDRHMRKVITIDGKRVPLVLFPMFFEKLDSEIDIDNDEVEDDPF